MTDTIGETGVNILPPPANVYAEESVIGALMLDRDAIVKIAPKLKRSDFGQEKLGIIYQAILNLYARRVPADPVMLMAELEAMDALDSTGGLANIVRLITETPTAVHVEYYAALVVECALRRALITAGGDIVSMAYDKQAEIRDMLARARHTIGEMNDRSNADDYSTMGQLAEEYLARIYQLRENPGKILGIPTGFTRWDHHTGGLRPGALIVVAARPGMGKTTWALNIAYNVARKGRAVGLFSLEMSRQDLMGKLVGIETGVTSEKLDTGRLTEHEESRVVDAVARISELPLHIEDKGGLQIGEIVNRATRIKAEEGLDVLIVDYLQLVKATPKKNSMREQEISEVARGLKEVARTLGIPVVACCQLNREIEKRADKVPQLSDLRESGEIEQAADIVVFIHRDEEYDKESTRAGIADLYIKKNRNGPTATIPLFCDMASGRFGDLAIGR